MLYSSQSFRAYRKWVEVNGEEALLPGLNMTHEQVQAKLAFLLRVFALFFIPEICQNTCLYCST